MRCSANGNNASTPSPTITYYTESGGFNHPYIDPAYSGNSPWSPSSTARLGDHPNTGGISGVFSFNFVNIAQVTDGPKKGLVLDAVEWGFIVDPTGGVLPRQGFNNKSIIRSVAAWSSDVADAINLRSTAIPNSDPVIPFTW